MTTAGENRARYSREVEPAPSRFTDPAAYSAWCDRADKWAASEEAPYYQIIHRLNQAVFGTYNDKERARSVADSLNNDYQTDVYVVIARRMDD